MNLEIKENYVSYIKSIKRSMIITFRFIQTLK